MKKLIVVLIMSIFCSVSLAESFESKFETMNDQEILICYQLIMKQMENRGISPYSSEHGVNVPAGVYTIGTDIPQGSYRIVFPNDEYDFGYINIFDENGDALRMLSVGKSYNVPEIGKIDLVGGMTFELQNTSSVFYTYKGLFGDFSE